MHRSLLAFILFVFFLAVPNFAESEKSNAPILSASPGKSIIGRSLPPGTYRVIPDLRPGQREASISVTLVEVDSGKPSIPGQSEIGDVTEPVNTDIPQTQTNSPQDKKLEDPSGTGPEYDCEYGLPRRDGANCEIQLTPGDMPAGLHLDDSANFNKACEVHQWIMHGSDRKNRIEVNISVWGDRAKSYFNWKHRMLATGEFNQLYIPPARAGNAVLGTQQLYVEEKASCNKQIIMQVGNYLVENHRPSVEGLTQQTDPISKEKFEAIAKACESRIAAVAGIPDRQMMEDNPSEFRWGNTAVWPVSFVNGILKVQGAGKPKWGTKWVTVDSGIKSYRGQGTGAGPVVTYTKDNKSWTVILLDHATGEKKNQRNFKYRVDIRSVGRYGATLRVAGRCYDYSWNHLKEIDCGSGNFTQGGKSNKPENEDPKTIQDKKDPTDVTPTTGTGGQTGQGVPTNKAPDVKHLSKVKSEPDTYFTTPSDVDMSCPEPPSHVKRFFPGVSEYVVGDRCEMKIFNMDTGKVITGGWYAFFTQNAAGKKGSLGHFEGDVFCAENPGCDWVGWAHAGHAITAWLVRVVPGQEKPLPGKPWSTSPEELLSGRVYVMRKAGPEYVNGVRISLNRVDGRNLETESKTEKNQAGQNEKGHYGFTGIELGRLPKGIYSIRCYKQTGAVATDLWHKKKTEHRVQFPFKPGEKFLQDIELIQAGQKWNNYDLNDLDKKLNQ